LSYSTGQVSDPSYHIKVLQNLMFLLNSRYPLLSILIVSLYTEGTDPICRVPSHNIRSYAFIFSTSTLVLVLVQSYSTAGPSFKYRTFYKKKPWTLLGKR